MQERTEFVSRETAKTLIHDRAIEMALNNVGFKADASDILEHISKRSMDWIDSIPAADVVEVVRCKDCRYYFFGDCTHNEGMKKTDKDGFCFRFEVVPNE